MCVCVCLFNRTQIHTLRVCVVGSYCTVVRLALPRKNVTEYYYYTAKASATADP